MSYYTTFGCTKKIVKSMFSNLLHRDCIKSVLTPFFYERPLNTSLCKRDILIDRLSIGRLREYLSAFYAGREGEYLTRTAEPLRADQDGQECHRRLRIFLKLWESFAGIKY